MNTFTVGGTHTLFALFRFRSVFSSLSICFPFRCLIPTAIHIDIDFLLAVKAFQMGKPSLVVVPTPQTRGVLHSAGHAPRS